MEALRGKRVGVLGEEPVVVKEVVAKKKGGVKKKAQKKKKVGKAVVKKAVMKKPVMKGAGIKKGTGGDRMVAGPLVGGAKFEGQDDVLVRVRDVLLELMAGSSSDAVRVAAAKALIDKILKNEPERGGEDEGGVRDAGGDEGGITLEAAMREAEALLDALRAEKIVKGGVGE